MVLKMALSSLVGVRSSLNQNHNPRKPNFTFGRAVANTELSARERDRRQTR
jgi:hypothetical protein